MDGWLVFWKIKIVVMIAPAIAVKIMAVLHNGFMLLALLSQYKQYLSGFGEKGKGERERKNL
jgi:hypothetical protein